MDQLQRSRLNFIFLFGSAVFNILDYFLTMEVLKRGYTEWNPVINRIIDTPLMPLLKVVVIPLILFLIWQSRHRIGQRLVYYGGVLFTIYSLLMIYFVLIFLL